MTTRQLGCHRHNVRGSQIDNANRTTDQIGSNSLLSDRGKACSIRRPCGTIGINKSGCHSSGVCSSRLSDEDIARTEGRDTGRATKSNQRRRSCDERHEYERRTSCANGLAQILQAAEQQNEEEETDAFHTNPPESEYVSRTLT
jgi:hypothetical protein